MFVLSPLQIVAVLFVAMKVGFGLTVTTMVKAPPAQNVGAGPVGITEYVMFIGLPVELIGVSVIFPLPPLPLLPVHANVALGTFDVGVIFNDSPEQIRYVPAATELPTGVGKTLTNTDVVGP